MSEMGQKIRQDLRKVGDVFDDQDIQGMGVLLADICPVRQFGQRLAVDRGSRMVNRAPFPTPSLTTLTQPPVEFGDALDDGQSEAKAAEAVGQRGIRPVRRARKMEHDGGIDAVTGILNADQGLRFLAVGFYHDPYAVAFVRKTWRHCEADCRWSG